MGIWMIILIRAKSPARSDAESELESGMMQQWRGPRIYEASNGDAESERWTARSLARSLRTGLFRVEIYIRFCCCSSFFSCAAAIICLFPLFTWNNERAAVSQREGLDFRAARGERNTNRELAHYLAVSARGASERPLRDAKKTHIRPIM
jgi:hypothetical protein